MNDDRIMCPICFGLRCRGWAESEVGGRFTCFTCKIKRMGICDTCDCCHGVGSIFWIDELFSGFHNPWDENINLKQQEFNLLKDKLLNEHNDLNYLYDNPLFWILD